MHNCIRRYVRHGTLVQFLVIDAIVRHGSYTRAARELHMAQPTVSIHMKKLAETIGAPLVEHSPRGVKLTPAGEKVHATAQRVLAVLHDLKGEICEAQVPAATHTLPA